MKNFLLKTCFKFFIFFLITCGYIRAQNAENAPWYSFSADNKECIIKKSSLPTPWLNRLGNDVFFTWITQNGYVESFLLDPVYNGLTNPQNTSGRFYVRDKSNGSFFQINIPNTNLEKWESRVGLGYNKISNEFNGIRAEATYFIPREDNVLVIMVDVMNNSGRDKELDLFGQVEWNLGDATKSIIYKGDGRGGSQFNLYKKAFMHDNMIIARQENWRSTGNCVAWPYTGFFSVSEPVTSYETIKENFLGVGRDYDHPEAIEKGNCSNTDFWSRAQYPCGVLQNTIKLKNGEARTLIYLLGMSREEKDISSVTMKYKNPEYAKKSLNDTKAFYDKLADSSVSIETPDKTNDRMINIWTKYQWRQFWKKNLNNGSYGLGLWSYGLEGESLGSSPEQFLLPFDMNILKSSFISVVQRQMSDTTQTDVFGPGEHSMLYKDLGLEGPPISPKGPFQFKVPHHHSIFELFSIYYYIIETGDLKMLDIKIPFADGKEGSIWQHIQTGLAISVKGIDERGFPKIPANVGDWMDEFTKISKNGDAESEMLAAEMCFLLKGFAEIAQKTNHDTDYIRWMGIYNKMKDAINNLAWDGEWYIKAFSDRGNPFIPIGTKSEKEGMIYLNGQSWPILSGVASTERATKSLLSVKKYLMSDYGPMIFSPSYNHYVDYIGTQSIYAPGFRNACIYLRPTGWAVAAACLNNQPELANELYDKASMKSREKDMDRYHCEPYVYPENYDGPDHLLKGQGEFQWNLGEGSGWMWASYVDYILGVRPVLDGLLIQPEIPAYWSGYKVKRPFRGSTYNIEVKNPGKVSSGIRYIKVDGKKITGNIVTSYKDGKNHTVEVMMGSDKQ